MIYSYVSTLSGVYNNSYTVYICPSWPMKILNFSGFSTTEPPWWSVTPYYLKLNTNGDDYLITPGDYDIDPLTSRPSSGKNFIKISTVTTTILFLLSVAGIIIYNYTKRRKQSIDQNQIALQPTKQPSEPLD